jgi:predicted GIY-YIG superfamily endonuclease
MVLYIGVTNNLQRKINEHLESKGSLFINNYNRNDLLYFEEFISNIFAIKRKKN